MNSHQMSSGFIAPRPSCSGGGDALPPPLAASKGGPLGSPAPVAQPTDVCPDSAPDACAFKLEPRTAETRRSSFGAPAAGSPTPAAGSPTPAAGSPTPAVGSPTPAAGSPTPAAGSRTPAAGSATPAAGSPTPAAGSPTPAAGSPTPAAGSPTPAAGSPTPAASSPTLGAGGVVGSAVCIGGSGNGTNCSSKLNLPAYPTMVLIRSMASFPRSQLCIGRFSCIMSGMMYTQRKSRMYGRKRR